MGFFLRGHWEKKHVIILLKSKASDERRRESIKVKYFQLLENNFSRLKRTLHGEVALVIF
jgi:hypothetical protein